MNFIFDNIIFDFDGVILDSVPVKTNAFRIIFQEYGDDKVEKIIEYHLENGGLSRYEKIEYFFKVILGRKISKNEIDKYANLFSKITLNELAQKKYIITDTIKYIRTNYKKYNMHIASGASETDLKLICDKLDIAKYFISIHGSPKEKTILIKDILLSYSYKKKNTCLVGDSINDYKASAENGIDFFGFNNSSLKMLGYSYISSFQENNISKTLI